MRPHGRPSTCLGFFTGGGVQSVLTLLCLVALLRCSWSPPEAPSGGGGGGGGGGKLRAAVSASTTSSQRGPAPAPALAPTPAPAPAPAPSALEVPLSAQRFLISSVIYYGRISNITITLLELLASAALGGRTLVVPELSECAVDGYDRSFGGIFDDSTPLARRVLSLGSFDFEAACNGSAVFVDPGHFPGGPHGTASLGDLKIPGSAAFPVVNVVDLPPTPGDVVFGKAAASQLLGSRGFITTSQQAAGPIHSAYYAPGQRRTFEGYRKDPLFLEKLAARGEKCVVLGKNFQAVNWERAPELFVSAVRSLVPAPPIRAAALAFLGAHGLAGGAGGCPLGDPAAAQLSSDAMALACAGGAAGLSGWGTAAGPASAAPAASAHAHFLGIHLRMGDFLTDDTHKSFGVACNADPAGTIGAVVARLLQAHPHLDKIVVATDDYSSPCYAQGLAGAWGARVVAVGGGSGYRGSTCSAALFDQEVLSHAAVFVGDKESSFSEAIHRGRTLRCGAPVGSTTWL